LHFVGLLLCLVAIILLFIKYRYMWKGELVEGEIVGFERGSKSTHGLTGYNYRIRIRYEGEIFIAKAIDGVVTGGGYPELPINRQRMVYFNPKKPEKVSLAGSHGAEIAAYSLFILGFLAILAYFGCAK